MSWHGDAGADWEGGGWLHETERLATTWDVTVLQARLLACNCRTAAKVHAIYCFV